MLQSEETPNLDMQSAKLKLLDLNAQAKQRLSSSRKITEQVEHGTADSSNHAFDNFEKACCFWRTAQGHVPAFRVPKLSGAIGASRKLVPTSWCKTSLARRSCSKRGLLGNVLQQFGCLSRNDRSCVPCRSKGITTQSCLVFEPPLCKPLAFVCA